jgi:hypothetical protein
MDHSLYAYLASLSVLDQRAYCRAAGTSLGYLRKFLSLLHHHGRHMQMDVRIVAALVAHSQGRVTFASMRPDVDWGCVRRELQRTDIPPLSPRPTVRRPRRNRGAASEEAGVAASAPAPLPAPERQAA